MEVRLVVHVPLDRRVVREPAGALLIEQPPASAVGRFQRKPPSGRGLCTADGRPVAAHGEQYSTCRGVKIDCAEAGLSGSDLEPLAVDLDPAAPVRIAENDHI